MTESRVIITADANRGVQEFQRFRAQAVGALEHVSQAGGVIGKVLGAAGASLSVAAFTGWIKGAIDATDAASDLSQKTGIAIGDLAGMELAFKKGGMEAGALESTMSKLSKQIVDGNEAFEKLGVKTKDASGQLKSNKDMLYELADKFADMEDGVQKTALAQEIFGKSGAAMIPMLNEGSEGLRAMDDMARKLGLTLSEETVEQAGNFNDTLDLLVLGGQGVAREIAAELLPTLSNLTGQFLTTMTSGDKLKNTAAFLAAGLKILYIAGVATVEVFSTVGKTVGAAGAQLVALLQGNFSQAAEIGRMWKEDIGNGWKATLKSIEDAWADSSNASVDSMVNFTRHSTVVGQSAAELAEQSKKAAKAHQEEAKALAEVAGLTGDFAGEWDKLSSLYGKGKISLEQLTKAQADLLAKQPVIKAAAEEEEKQRKALTESAEQYAKAYDLAADAKAKALAGLQAQRDENDAIGLGAIELAELNAQRVESRAQRAEENAEIAEGLDLSGELAQRYREEAEALRALAGEMRRGELLKAADEEAKKSAGERKKLWEDIERTAHDTFISIFDSGKSAFDRLKDALKNGLYELLYQMTVKKWIINISGQASSSGGIDAITSMFGGSNGGTGSIFSNASSLISMGKTLYSGFSSGMASSMGGMVTKFGSMFGSQAVTDFGAGMSVAAEGGTSIGMTGAGSAGLGVAKALPIIGWIAAGMSLSNSLYKQGWDAQNGSLTDSWGGKAHMPFNAPMLHLNTVLQKVGLSNSVANMLSGASTVSRLFGRKNPEIESQGIRGTFGGSGFSGDAYANIVEKGGLFRSTKRYEQSAPLATEQDASFDATYKALVDAAKGFASTLGIETSVIEGYNKQIKLELGKDEAKNQEAIAKMFGEIGDELSLRLVPNLSTFAKAGEATSATLQRLVTDYATVDEALTAIGMQFGAVGLQSLSARGRLIEASGGLEAFAANTAGFQQNFLTESERLAPVMKSVTEQLASMGKASIDSREEFRDYFRSLDPSNEADSKRIGQLLKLQAAFAMVYPEIEDTAAAAKAAADALAQTNKGYQDQIDELLRARMSPQEQRAADIAGMDASTVLLYDRVTALKEEAAALEALKERSASVASERLGLQNELDDLTLSAAEKLRKQRDALDESNRALFDQVQAATAARDAFASLQQTLESITGARAGIADDIFNAQLGGKDLNGKIAQLTAAEEALWAQVGTGANSVDVLAKIKALAMQRIGFEDQLQDEAIAKLKEQYDVRKTALTDELAAMTKMRDYAANLRQFADGLKLGSLSALSPAAQLAEAEKQYRKTLGLAQGGDASAQGNLQGIAQSYLELSKQFFGSTTSYASMFAGVIADIEKFAAPTESEFAAVQQQISAVNDMSGTLGKTVRDTSARQVEVLTKIDGALQKAQESTEAQLRQTAAANAALVDELKKANTKLASLEDRLARMEATA